MNKVHKTVMRDPERELLAMAKRHGRLTDSELQQWKHRVGISDDRAPSGDIELVSPVGVTRHRLPSGDIERASPKEEGPYYGLLESVFSRKSTDAKEISSAGYNAIIGLVLCWGFFVNWLLVVNINPETLWAINGGIFFLGYFASCFFGIYLFNSSDKPLVSFIGYNFVVVPFGLIVNMVVAEYEPDLVVNAITTTAEVTVVMMILGSTYPRFFEKISNAITIALLAVLVIELTQIFFLRIHHDWIDWAVVVIFCGYVGYDWGRANQIPKTVDNAVDSAAELYMDIINLFVRILRIFARR